MIIEYIVLIKERWWFTGNIYVLPKIRYDSGVVWNLPYWMQGARVTGVERRCASVLVYSIKS